MFKNAIDWIASRAGAKMFAGRPVAPMGASPGGFGTILAQNHWLPVLRTLQTRPYFEGRLLVSGAGKLFDAQGSLSDEATLEKLRVFLDGFVRAVRG